MQDRELEERVKRALEESRLTRRSLLRRSVVFGAGLTALPAIAAACGGDETSTSGATGTGGGAPSVPASGADISMDDLVAAAKEEGTLNTIALPPDWANYGEIMDTFQSKYGITINNANPNGSSAEENQAVKSLKGQDRAPDVLDVGPSFAVEGKSGGLYANYKNSQWDTIPDDLKDADGAWVGDYWGAVSLGANTKVAPLPASWADLKKPEYKGKVALNGDPRESGSAFAAVFAASVANGGSLDDIQPGIDFFAELKDIRQLHPGRRHAGNGRQRPDSGHDRLGLPADRLRLRVQVEHHVGSDRPGRRGGRELLLPGDQRRRAESVRRPALAGVPLLGRGPASLAQGVFAPGPVPGHVRPRRRPAGPARRSALGGPLREHRVPDPGAERRGDADDRRRLERGRGVTPGGNR